MLIVKSNWKSFTKEVAEHCAILILSENDENARDLGIEDVMKELRDDYAKGDIYNRYASKKGYGFIFYMFVVPSYM
jgi:hypothetical protein